MLSRIQICAKYGLQPATFNAVSPLLRCTPIELNGRTLYEVSPHDDFIFTCARLHPASYVASRSGQATLYPFHRFLLLKFLTVGFDELIADIKQRNLAPGLENSALKYMEKQFYALLPKSMRDLAKAKQPPTDDLREKYQIMLKVLGIDIPYNHPLWLDKYCAIAGDPDLKALLETVMTTHGRVGDWQEALTSLARFQWNSAPLEFYASIFYDRNHLSEGDWERYLMVLAPSERNAKRQAQLMTTVQLCAHEAKTVEFMKTMKSAAVSVQLKIMRAIQGNDQNFRELQTMLVTYNSLGKATGELAEVSAAPGGFFHNVVLEASPNEAQSIEDIEEGRQAKAGA